MNVPHGWSEKDWADWTALYRADRAGIDQPAEPAIRAVPAQAWRLDEFAPGGPQVPNSFDLTAAPVEGSCFVSDRYTRIALDIYDVLVDGQIARLTKRGWEQLQFLHDRGHLQRILIKYLAVDEIH